MVGFMFRSFVKLSYGLIVTGMLVAASQTVPAMQADVSERERQLEDRIRVLEQRLAEVESRLGLNATAAQSPTAARPDAPDNPVATKAKQDAHAIHDDLPDHGFDTSTSLRVLLDGYYEYNGNNPIGGVTFLRPFDPSSNSFILSQAAIVLDRPSDLAQERRLGMHLEFLFGQSAMAAANRLNEQRPMPYRNILQMYGSYLAPIGTGLTVAFGRFGSPLALEGMFAHDQMNYSRSLIFTAMPFYHMGFRTSYRVSRTTTLTWFLVNGANQMEDFNVFKSNLFMVTSAPSDKLRFSALYYAGRDGRRMVPIDSSGADTLLPTQPGFSVTPVSLVPDGRTHITDAFLRWNTTSKLTLAAEVTDTISRTYAASAPMRLTGGAGYVKYQLAPSFFLSARGECLSDHGGYLSGQTQTLGEGTVTATYQPLDRFQVRWELRRDISSHPFFLTSAPGILSKYQTTALIGLLWWFNWR